ncbi:hypothetical protein LI90_2738 [Carbonactinospora thermoautotrophica]|uniref:Uncharacterized protein n=1 Tax=Carbonactinospora thermoautotrophica TaxID=1469144 RepID=A0A132MVE2_9ACTN|nr:hypothetical protein [Carbonactinospora thermoautotrophica]KWX01706.1 hypothetical protein LI90_2738 [Carbonactinospora thermoautotrophica]
MTGAAGLVVTGLAVAASVPLAAPAAQPAEDGTCVQVVVDTRSAGGGVQTACAASDPSSGLDALKNAGIPFQQRPDGLVCVVAGVPREGCAATSATRFWSYWTREPGATSWRMSQVAPAQHDPRPGGAEGWVWGDGRTPPPEVPASATPTSVGGSQAAQGQSADRGTAKFAWLAGLVLLLCIGGAAFWRARRGSGPA